MTHDVTRARIDVEDDDTKLIRGELGDQRADRDPGDVLAHQRREHEQERVGACFAKQVLRDESLHLRGALTRDHTSESAGRSKGLSKTCCASDEDVDAPVAHSGHLLTVRLSKAERPEL